MVSDLLRITEWPLGIMHVILKTDAVVRVRVTPHQVSHRADIAFVNFSSTVSAYNL